VAAGLGALGPAAISLMGHIVTVLEVVFAVGEVRKFSPFLHSPSIALL